MEPACGEQLVRYVGDTIQFTLRNVPAGHSVFLRTNIGRANLIRQEIIQSIQEPEVQLEASWRDVPLKTDGGDWHVIFALTEVGWFQSKAYAIDQEGRQHWPDGGNFGLSVHPNSCRMANTIYCAFPRMFGPNKYLRETSGFGESEQIHSLDQDGYTVIPPGGTLRDLREELPHIFERLGCRILHLLPVNPTPTIYARMGRFGSPYACGDLTAVDPSLVVFDKRATGVEQFCELADAVHGYGGQLFLDLVINHTGWGSTLQETHPEWFLREDNGDFASPGAWGNVWSDLVELNPNHPELWEHMAEAFLTWSRRGVDGFRCDAGYKVPMPVWRYIIARVREEFPDTIFLLEGLGGGWEDTSNLLTSGGMQWAYSELFQEFEGPRVAAYLDHALAQSKGVGTLIHYSETHDNTRLAEKGRRWSLFRNRLCALTSVNGGFGFTNGVEWLANEQVNVHAARGLNWDADENIVDELAKLNQLLQSHPCFFEEAILTRLSPDDSDIYALRRESPQTDEIVFIIANSNIEEPRALELHGIELAAGHDLLGQKLPEINGSEILLKPCDVFCLSLSEEGQIRYDCKATHAQNAMALQCLSHQLEPENIGNYMGNPLGDMLSNDPVKFLNHISRCNDSSELLKILDHDFPRVSIWTVLDSNRIMLVPTGNWILVHDDRPFVVNWMNQTTQSIQVKDGHIVSFCPQFSIGDAELTLRRLGFESESISGTIRLLPQNPENSNFDSNSTLVVVDAMEQPIVLLTNGIGGMARMAVDLGVITSKYDCLLGANLNSDKPVDRHIFAKRVRIWAVADGFISELNAAILLEFSPGPPARWRFLVSAGDSRAVEIELQASMPDQQNETHLTVTRLKKDPEKGQRLADGKSFSITVRVDIEDRIFHAETNINEQVERHFSDNISCDSGGFIFTPSHTRQLSVRTTLGVFHEEMEWCTNVAHPIEANRGHQESGDACSPGWFEIPMKPDDTASIVVSAENNPSMKSELFAPVDVDSFSERLKAGITAFVVKRGKGKTVIAGYPWFLDWGRDTFIAARGLLAAGYKSEVNEIVKTFAGLEEHGSLPNVLNGDDVSNRNTSDASLWFCLVSEELAKMSEFEVYSQRVGDGRTMREVIVSIGEGYRRGMSNGVCADAQSGLIWSPSHFTWMDTNYPAGTPRVGYPVEIQALWIRLLAQLRNIQPDRDWGDLEKRAKESLSKKFCGEDQNWVVDNLSAPDGGPANMATADTALRSNCLIAISLGVINGQIARKTVLAAQKYLLVPGAVRSLAPLPVELSQPIVGNEGQKLNDPDNPYWGRYEGDEDTRRKPAYHNGTAWCWKLPVFCQALAMAWEFSDDSVRAAKSYLLSMENLFHTGCINHLPEVLDGDTPHTQRGCDAQAWSVSEAYRVWKLLNEN